MFLHSLAPTVLMSVQQYHQMASRHHRSGPIKNRPPAISPSDDAITDKQLPDTLNGTSTSTIYSTYMASELAYRADIIGIGPVSGPTPQRFKKRDRLQGPIPVYSLNRVVTTRLCSRRLIQPGFGEYILCCCRSQRIFTLDAILEIIAVTFPQKINIILKYNFHSFSGFILCKGTQSPYINLRT